MVLKGFLIHRRSNVGFAFGNHLRSSLVGWKNQSFTKFFFQLTKIYTQLRPNKFANIGFEEVTDGRILGTWFLQVKIYLKEVKTLDFS